MVSTSLFILAGFESHIKSYIIVSIFLIVVLIGSGKEERTYTSFGRAYFFITVILPINVTFLCCHCFKHYSKSLILGSRFARNILSLLVQKVIPSVLASVELHWNFLPFKYTMLRYFQC